MTEEQSVLDEAIEKIDSLCFSIPTYYQQYITTDIFKAVLDDRNKIKNMLERLKNER